MRIGDCWGSLRGIVRDQFSFAQIKDLTGAAGIPIHKLAHLQQQFSGGASKGQLMDGIDGLVAVLSPQEQDRFVAHCIREVLERRPACRPEVETVLERVGWGIVGTEPHPLRLQIDIEATTLPPPVQDGLAKSLRRYRDGDTSGAMSAICGVIDSLTESVYQRQSLANHRDDSYQQRVSKAFSALEAPFKQPLNTASLTSDEVNRIWQNHRGAVNQAAYVLASFRREFSDAHGEQNAPLALVQRALDCAIFIVRSLTALM